MIIAYYICWLCLIAGYAIWVLNVALWIVETVERIGQAYLNARRIKYKGIDL